MQRTGITSNLNYDPCFSCRDTQNMQRTDITSNLNYDLCFSCCDTKRAFKTRSTLTVYKAIYEQSTLFNYLPEFPDTVMVLQSSQWGLQPF